MPVLDPANASPVNHVLNYVPPGGFPVDMVSSMTGDGSPVDTVRPELLSMLSTYAEIRDVVAGEKAVKGRGTTYLPAPNEDDTNPARYRAYLLRAVFYGVTRRTLLGLVGLVAVKPAVIVVPPLMNAVVKDATGSGVTLEQLGLALVAEVAQLGRAGVLADYPTTNGVATTVKDQQDGAIRPTITNYTAEAIINWRMSKKNGRTYLSLVVLAEVFDDDSDDFTIKRIPQRRVLRIEKDGKYSVEIWRKPDESGSWIQEPKTYPTDAAGQHLTEIPFKFIGSVDNNSNVDPAPLADMASLNLAHYRNSADYEEGVFVTGQPTPVISGLTETWWKNVLGERINFGSRAGVPLETGATMELLQADPNNAALEAMKSKEEQMKSLGAKLVQVSTVQRTATETASDDVTETSVLGQIVSNVNAAVLWCLEWAAIFSGATTVNRDAVDVENKTIDFALNKDFDSPVIDREDATAATTYWKDGAITFGEMRTVLRGAKIATEKDEEAKEQIDKDKLDNMKTFGVDATGAAIDKTDEEDPDADKTPTEDDDKEEV